MCTCEETDRFDAAPRIRWSTVSDAGSCTACNRQRDLDRKTAKVLVITGASTETRLCPFCVSEVSRQKLRVR
jgi:uncharacterized protein CbrC (UPF0167 family)